MTFRITLSVSTRNTYAILMGTDRSVSLAHLGKSDVLAIRSLLTMNMVYIATYLRL